ncbi:hypothetical protein [Clostridium sardiniense]|uniref:hypothetical protein n=1 Tax=Clostridium sardiniense TaxID=29369 RepID=UPI003D325659
MKKIFIAFILGVSVLGMVGCADKESKNENNQEVVSKNELLEKEKAEEEAKKQEELKLAEEKAKEEKAKKEAEEKKKKEAEEKKKKEQEAKNNNQNKDTNIKEKTFTLYSVDVSNDKTITIGNVKTKSDDIKENLDSIASSLSKKNFKSFVIEVKEIKKVKGKSIAYINLKDSGNKKWTRDYFQGSTGGYITSTSLIESFLQRKYKGDWIDGVAFTYNNKKVEDTGHIPALTQINYR